MNMLKEFWQEEEGMSTAEVLLIMAALVCVALIFREAIVGFVTSAIDSVFGAETQDGLKVKEE